MKIAILIGLFALAQSVPLQSENESVFKSVVGNFVNCMNSDISLCLKEHALKATERLGTVRNLKISDSLILLNHVNPKEGRSLEPLSSELDVRKEQVSQRLWASASDLLSNAELEYSYGGSDEEDDDESRALGDVEESRGKKKKEIKKKLKLLLPLAILAKVKAGVLALLFLGIIAVSIFKLAAIAKIALLAKLFAIIKALLAKKQQGGGDDHGWTPHHDEHAHHSSGWDSGAASQGWSRSRTEAQNMAYAAQRK